MKARSLRKQARRADRRLLEQLCRQYTPEWAGTHKGRRRVVRMLEREVKRRGAL